MIINADDFGLDARVNRAIIRAFDEGLVSSTTIMANMPGFEDGCALARDRGLLEHVGTHLVLSDGEPLTAAMRSCRRFCDERGRFTSWRLTSRAAWLPREDRQIVLDELAGAGPAVPRGGAPDHASRLSSPRPRATRNPPLAVAVARELGVPAIRVAVYTGAGRTTKLRLSRTVTNARLRRAGLARTTYFGTVDGYLHLASGGGDPVRLDDFDVMTHPALDDRDALVDALHPGTLLRDHVGRLPGYATPSPTPARASDDVRRGAVHLAAPAPAGGRRR